MLGYRLPHATYLPVDSKHTGGRHPKHTPWFALYAQGGGGGGGASREDVVFEKAAELLERLPEDYIEDDYKAKLQKLGGLAVPLNIFLFQVTIFSLWCCCCCCC